MIFLSTVTLAAAGELRLDNGALLSEDLPGIGSRHIVSKAGKVAVESAQWSLDCDTAQMHSLAFSELRSLPRLSVRRVISAGESGSGLPSDTIGELLIRKAQ